MFVPEDHTGCGARPIPAARRNRTSADALRLARPTARTGTLLTHDTRRVREAVKLGYDLRAPEFGKGATRRHRAHRMAVPEVAHGARVLDVGAGTGRSTAPVIEQNSAAVVIGLDLSAAMLRRALDSFRGRVGVGWVQGDAERLPLADRSFDLVVSRRALSHLPDPCEAFREIARVLTPGGVVDVTLFGDRALGRPVERFLRTALRETLGDRADGLIGLFRPPTIAMVDAAAHAAALNSADLTATTTYGWSDPDDLVDGLLRATMYLRSGLAADEAERVGERLRSLARAAAADRGLEDWSYEISYRGVKPSA